MTSVRRNESGLDGTDAAGASGGMTSDEAAPDSGERTIYVSDDGLLDTAEFDQLTADFRHSLGLLPDEEQELSEVFKVRIGLANTDRDQFERLADEIDSAMADGSQRREETIRRNRLEHFARKHFQPGSPAVQFSTDTLRRPLLAKNSDMEKRASLVVWIAIQRFLNGAVKRKSTSAGKGLEAPIISRVWDQLESRETDQPQQQQQQQQPLRRTVSTPVDSSSGSRSVRSRGTVSGTSSVKDNARGSKSTGKRLSLKKLFRGRSSTDSNPPPGDATSHASSSSSDGTAASLDDAAAAAAADGAAAAGLSDDTDLLTDDVMDSIPSTELDLVNFIVAHGILKKELRDEIYCQLCCQVTKNPSAESRKRGWILHALCAGCFLPSMQLLSYYYGFLYDISSVDTLYYANHTRKILRRTNMNGMRFHPPSSVELAALKDQKSMCLDISLSDRRLVSVDVDSASTSCELCDAIASKISIKDQFGFSLYITINDKVSSLGSGLDHVMDAITECEQLVRSQGRLESTAKWRLFYRKELFTPWYSPAVDQISTDLIYRQIVEGVRTDEYRLHSDDVYTYVARCLYVEHGRQLQMDSIKTKMADYMPKSFIANNSNSKSRDAVSKTVMASFETQGFSGYAVPAKFIQHEIVASASTVWPTHFSAMFEAFRCEGPALPRNDVIMAINSGGIFLLDNVNYEVVVGFHYYDIVDCIADSTTEVRHACVSLVAIDGAQFKFLTPNAETIARIVKAFLEGLRRRSRWAVALTTVVVSDRVSSSARLGLRPGDVIELLSSSRSDGDDVNEPRPSTSSARDDEEQLLLYGRCDRTGDRGSFPHTAVYILPTIDKPSSEFLTMLTSLSRDNMETLPRRRPREATIVIEEESNDEYGTESSA